MMTKKQSMHNALKLLLPFIFLIGGVLLTVIVHHHHHGEQQQRQPPQKINNAQRPTPTSHQSESVQQQDRPTTDDDSTPPFSEIEIQQYKWFDSITGREIQLRGIDYYPRPNVNPKPNSLNNNGQQDEPLQQNLDENSLDLFTNEYAHIWERDIPYLKQLNVNAIRLYAVNATLDHSAFMCALQEAGIYVIVALAHDCPTCAITRDAAPKCYPNELKTQGQLVINEFSKYKNTLAYSVGNEVNHFAPTGQPERNAICQKKFLSDMRKYVSKCHRSQQQMRNIPIGLVSADNDREKLAMYYNCEESSKFDTAEWYGLNTYVACDGTAQTYHDAKGFQKLAKSFEKMNYSIPVVLTEFGCLSPSFPNITSNGGDIIESQRTFLQAKWLLSEPKLQEQFTGGFAFEYSIEMENAKSESKYPFDKFGHQNYGIGYFSPEHCDDVTVMCEYHKLPAFDNLKQSYSAESETTTAMASFVPDPYRLSKSKCPKQFPRMDSFRWSTDRVRDLKCPSSSTSTSSFQCPASYKTLLEQEQVSNDDNNDNHNHHWLIRTFLLVVGIAIVMMVIGYFRFRPAEDDVADSRHTPSSSLETSNLLTSTVSIKSSYTAIESESSSEDLERMA